MTNSMFLKKENEEENNEDGTILIPPGVGSYFVNSGNSSSWLDGPDNNDMFQEDKNDKPNNGQIVLGQLPDLVGGLFGGVAALINATNGTTPNTINNSYQNTNSNDEKEKEDKTVVYVLAAVGFILILLVVFFVMKSMKSKNNARKSNV